VPQRHQALRAPIPALKAERPFWGDRRIWADLRFVEQRPVHQKRILRRRREPHRLVTPTMKRKAKRPPTRNQPQPTRPKAWWGSARTKVWVQGFGWIDSGVGLAWSTTALVGDSAGVQSQARDGLTALDMAVHGQCPAGVRGQGLSRMRANGCQPPSTALMRACGTLGIQHTCTSSNNLKGNAATARMLRTLQAEGPWRHEWTCPFTRARILRTWIADDHEHYLHSAQGYKTPKPVERPDQTSHGTQFTAA
jgi:putative transposase